MSELALKEGSIEEAEDYYKEFCDLAADDARQYILRYMILKAKGAPAEQLIHTLEQYCNAELDENGCMSWQNCTTRLEWSSFAL